MSNNNIVSFDDNSAFDHKTLILSLIIQFSSTHNSSPLESVILLL